MNWTSDFAEESSFDPETRQWVWWKLYGDPEAASRRLQRWRLGDQEAPAAGREESRRDGAKDRGQISGGEVETAPLQLDPGGSCSQHRQPLDGRTERETRRLNLQTLHFIQADRWKTIAAVEVYAFSHYTHSSEVQYVLIRHWK